MPQINIDTFGEIMDKFVKEAHVQLLIDLPEGTTEAKLKDNTGMGAVMQFYIILNAVEQIFQDICVQMELEDTDKLADALCEMLNECMKAKEGEEEDDDDDGQGKTENV